MSEFLRGYESCHQEHNAVINRAVKHLDANPNYGGAVDAVNMIIEGAHVIANDLRVAKKTEGKAHEHMG